MRMRWGGLRGGKRVRRGRGSEERWRCGFEGIGWVEKGKRKRKT